MLPSFSLKPIICDSFATFTTFVINVVIHLRSFLLDASTLQWSCRKVFYERDLNSICQIISLSEDLWLNYRLMDTIDSCLRLEVQVPTDKLVN